jgi:hypothetical protein
MTDGYDKVLAMRGGYSAPAPLARIHTAMQLFVGQGPWKTFIQFAFDAWSVMNRPQEGRSDAKLDMLKDWPDWDYLARQSVPLLEDLAATAAIAGDPKTRRILFNLRRLAELDGKPAIDKVARGLEARVTELEEFERKKEPA